MIHVIDDDSAAADAIARTLRETGREVRISTSVTDAIATLAAETPSAVVLDLVLGTDASALHAALVRRRIPVLLVSGAEPARLPEVADPRGWRWLAKPCEPDALVSAVASLVDTPERPSQSSITRRGDGSVTATKSTAQVVSETIVDLVALAILGAVLIVVRPSNPWVQGGCVVGLLLLAGVRVADLVALSRGLPLRGGPSAAVLALLGAAASRLGGS